MQNNVLKGTIYTIGRHLVEQEKNFPHATGDFTNLLWDLTIAFKIISNQVNQAGLAEILGFAGVENVHGEDVQKLDIFAHNMIYRAMDHGGHLCVMASEESPDIIPIPKEFKKGKYVLLFDPLDGSSNIDVNVSIGTIFSILRRKGEGERDGTLEDCLQPGTAQVAAGYVLYGSSTMLVYTTGQGVFGFTLDPSIGEFLLSHRIQIPGRGSTYSINEGYEPFWDNATRKYIRGLKTGEAYSLRYTGSFVADFHRTLLRGGIFLYPALIRNGSRHTKLRLLYEANPMAFVVEQAGGSATTGQQRILEVQPDRLHETVPLILGSRDEVNRYELLYRELRS